ncbi:hypothetical protein AC1031_012339, partial [Aphanomyces cochlioides]
MTKTKKLFMTAKVKSKIISHFQQNPRLTLRELCEWAYATQNIPSMPSTAAMSRALKKPVDHKTLKCHPNMKVRQPLTCPELEAELEEWIDDCEDYRISLS